MKLAQSTHPSKVIVIGGGIIGICSALYLQRYGYHVTMIDPVVPENSASRWNCGQLAVSGVVPLSKPGVFKKLPSWIMNQSSPLRIRPKAVLGLLPWLLRFVDCARLWKIAEIAEDLSGLTAQVHSDYTTLLDGCEGNALLSDRPVIEVFDTPAGLEQERPYLELQKYLGFCTEELGARDIVDLEPCLAGRFAHGVLYKDWRTVSDTEGFVLALSRSFIKQGGVRVSGAVKWIDEVADRATGVTLKNGVRLPADYVIVAAGVGSRKFFPQLGVDIPLAAAAGYQVLLPDPKIELRHSVNYFDGGFSFTPLKRGLKVGGTIEFVGSNFVPDFRRASIVLDKARQIFPGLNTRQFEYDIDYRPFLPDSKPVIDRSNRLSNVLMTFGHGQLGLTLAATSGRLIADMAAGRATQDLSPFSANRFSYVGGLEMMYSG